MNTLCIQVQPKRAPNLDMKRVCALSNGIASDKELVSRFSIVGGEDKGPYTNLMFETTALQHLWGILQEVLYRDSKVGSDLAQSSMAMCEGNDGWNDYILLYHFDPSFGGQTGQQVGRNETANCAPDEFRSAVGPSFDRLWMIGTTN